MLSIRDLSKTYKDRQALKNLNLYIAAGEVYGLLGPNGAGKTTAINLICGLLQADSGEVFVNGKVVSDKTRPWIGVMPQENLLYRTLSCEENLMFFARIYGLARRLRSRRVQECLAAVNLLDRAKTPVEKLSGGMQRRLSLAIAIVHRPKLLILDEPTTGLDIEVRHEVWELIRWLSREEGMTILLTTHLLDEAERLCDRIGIVKQGHLLTEGTLLELRQRIPAREIVTIETSEPNKAVSLGTAHGFTPRRYGSELSFWIPEDLALKDLIERFDGVPLDAISRTPVKLEHVYLEITRGPER
ncbi:ABC transporter ATP-binding protein [Oscillatoria sp. CS-180]|uniref:ABC transporter ATP-binding protein n=1 Tax=Oscillatoria sp. CS-180 TaxID=3021720 RepID=UPI00232DED27|nr:ABC transporter ATP-binding protein [Oscillatoria sp. CS-180]MDB9525983.1 ABC transporter ATP-binding protein [Oscillatoria sp. CS-180]